MATMIPCPACKNEISVEATACPKCGQPITDEIRTAGQKKSTKHVKWGRTFLIVILWVAIISYFVKDKDKDKNDAPTPSQAVNVPAFLLTAEQFVNNVNNFYSKEQYNTDAIKKELIRNNINLSARIAGINHNKTTAILNDIGKVIIDTNSKSMITNITCIIIQSDNESHNVLLNGIGFISFMAGIKPDWPQAKRSDTLIMLIKHFITNKQTTPITIDGIVFHMRFYNNDNKLHIALNMSPEK